MPTCLIDGKEVEFKPGENIVDAAKRAGIEIPVFCYHPGLSVVAQCRMCAVEIEGVKKIQTACSTKAAEGMKINTKSEGAKKARESVMEFLLINHPLDCPICDKSGECDLQDNSYKYGNQYMRYTEERRTYLDLDMGPVIKKNMNRCIHCTRCIRFGDEVAHIREMVALQRGAKTEITTVDGLPLQTDYAGNYADICPTGSLTLKDFRYQKRVWFLKKTPTICEGCSKGCNIELHWDNNVIQRTVPRENMEVNRHWICDDGRFNFHYTHDPERIVAPWMPDQPGPVNWFKAVDHARGVVSGRKVAVLIGSDLTQEEATLIKRFAETGLKGVSVFHFGTPGILSAKDDADEDKILKRLSKTSNLHGLEKLGIRGFEKLPEGTDAVIVFRGGRAQLPKLTQVRKVGVGVFNRADAEGYEVILAGANFAEKEGTIVNYGGREQKLMRAIVPPKGSKYLSEVIMLWENASGAALKEGGQ